MMNLSELHHPIPEWFEWTGQLYCVQIKDKPKPYGPFGTMRGAENYGKYKSAGGWYQVKSLVPGTQVEPLT